MRFATHYTLDQARALLPQVRKWLARLLRLRADLAGCENTLQGMMAPGKDLGGEAVHSWVKTLAEVKSILLEFHRRDIQIKDLERGLIDFPAIMADKEVFLCWEKCENDIEHWHDLDAGYAGREPISGDEF